MAPPAESIPLVLHVMPHHREVSEGTQRQSVNERVVHSFEFATLADAVEYFGYSIIDLTNNNLDVTTTVSTGDPEAAGSVISLPVLHSLTEDHEYKMIIEAGVEDAYGNPQYIAPYVVVVGEE
jgi:hypothetical protein